MIHVGEWLDRLARVDPQRWLLGAMSVATATVGSLAAGTSGGGHSVLVTTVIVAVATAATFNPATHAALPVVFMVTWQWLVTTDDALSPLVVVVAVAMVAFHALIALMAATPTAASLDGAIARRWSQRSAIAASAALVMWGAVALMDRREAPGSVAMTFLGFLTAAALVAAMRRQWWTSQ